MFSTHIRLTKFGPGFWSRVPGVGPGCSCIYRNFLKQEYINVENRFLLQIGNVFLIKLTNEMVTNNYNLKNKKSRSLSRPFAVRDQNSTTSEIP